jgi:hypothetical protein
MRGLLSMSSGRKSFALVASALCLLLAFLTSSMAFAQTTTHYGDKVGDSGANLVGFDLTTYSPENQKIYTDTMPLNFKIHWIYGLMFYNNAVQYGEYAYIIDNGPAVSLSSNQKSNSSKDFVVDPNFSYNIDISNLPSGQHQLRINAQMKWNPFGGAPATVCNQTSDPIVFFVQNPNTPTSTPTPTIPEFSWLAVLPFLALGVLVTVAIKRYK